MDPAILSFRQFSSFPHQGQMPPLHQQQQDLLLQHLAQNQQQNGQGKCILSMGRFFYLSLEKSKLYVCRICLKSCIFLRLIDLESGRQSLYRGDLLHSMGILFLRPETRN